MIDSRGHAVALNAGSKSSSASAFFLPLDRVVRALEAIGQSFGAVSGSDGVNSVKEGEPAAQNVASGDGGGGTAQVPPPSAPSAAAGVAAAAAGSTSDGGNGQEGGVGGGSEGSKAMLRSWRPPIVPRGTLQVGCCC